MRKGVFAMRRDVVDRGEKGRIFSKILSIDRNDKSHTHLSPEQALNVDSELSRVLHSARLDPGPENIATALASSWHHCRQRACARLRDGLGEALLCYR